MKPSKVTGTEARSMIERINGRANAHTFSAGQVAGLADWAESELARMEIPLKLRKGATCTGTSGDPLAKAYTKRNFHRITSYVRLVRGASDWVLTDYSVEQTYTTRNGNKKLLLDSGLLPRALEAVLPNVIFQTV